MTRPPKPKRGVEQGHALLFALGRARGHEIRSVALALDAVEHASRVALPPEADALRRAAWVFAKHYDVQGTIEDDR